MHRPLESMEMSFPVCAFHAGTFATTAAASTAHPNVNAAPCSTTPPSSTPFDPSLIAKKSPDEPALNLKCPASDMTGVVSTTPRSGRKMLCVAGRYCSAATSAKCNGTYNMLGGASQIVSRIRTKCNGNS